MAAGLRLWQVRFGVGNCMSTCLAPETPPRRSRVSLLAVLRAERANIHHTERVML